MKTKMKPEYGWALVSRDDTRLWFSGTLHHADVYLTRREARSVQDPYERIVRVEIRQARKAAKR